MMARFAACLAALLSVLGLVDSSRAEERVFRAGAFAADVSPQQFPVIVNGSMTERTADKLVDRLHARCLVVDDGSNQIAIAVVDSCMLPRELLDEAKRLAQAATGIPSEQMLISATHTHSAPASMGCLGSDRDEAYAAFLPAQIAKGIAQAQKNLASARIGWGVAQEPKNVHVRRFLTKAGTANTARFTGHVNDQAQMNPGYNNPNAIRRTGRPDTDVSVVSLQAKDGRPIALLANYSTHYAGAPAISADYFGVFADKIAERLMKDRPADDRPPFMAAMTNGTSGDANCLDFIQNAPRKFDYFSVAEDVAEAAMEACGRIEYFDWVPVVMREARLELKVRLADEKELAEAKAFVATFADRKPQTLDEVYAREAVLLSQMPPTRELKLQAIRLGDLGIASIPNEVYSVTGLTIKQDSPLPTTFTIELANGADGYIPTPDQHALGGYTTWRARTSCLEVDAEPKIRAVVLRLLREVDAARRDEPPAPATAARLDPRSSPSRQSVRPANRVAR